MCDEAPAMFECALAELLAEGVAADVGPLVQKFKDDPASLEEAYKKLPTTVLEPYLPAYDVARDDRLRNAALSEALREFKESLDEMPTPAALRQRRDKKWTPAVGDRCR